MSLVTTGGAEADNAMNGTLTNARRPPSFLNAVLKSEPLSESKSFKQNSIPIKIQNSNHSGMQ